MGLMGAWEGSMADAEKITMGHAQRILERCRDTIVAYEKRGLLTPQRTDGGGRIRLFDRAQVEALKARLDQASKPLG